MKPRTLLLDNTPVRIIRRDGDRVLVAMETYPFPRWIDAAELVKRQPAPFIPAPF
jgi:hypothetical protein